MAASTAMEALTAELLGDVGKLHDDVKSLHQLLPTMTKAAGDNLQVVSDKVVEALQLQGGHFLVAAEKIAANTQVIVNESYQAVEQAAISASETAKLDIRQAATAAAADAVGRTVGDEVAKVVSQVNNAANNLVTQASAARHEILGAARSVSWGFGRILGMIIAGGCISGLVVALGVPYLQGRSAVPAPDQETAKQIEAGRDFIQVLPQLDNVTREKVTRLILKNRAAEQK